MAKTISKRKRLAEPKHAVKVYQMKDRVSFSGSPKTLVVQQLVKRGNRYITDERKQKVISFAMFPGDREQELVKAIFTALRGDLRESPRHLTKDIKAEVKRVVVPVLNELGFDRSFWSFRRSREGQIDLLNFVFPKGMGFFFINIGKFLSHGYELNGKVIQAAKVEMKHLTTDKKSSQRFDYESGDLSQVTEAVTAYIREQATAWWSGAEEKSAAGSLFD